MTQQPLAGPSCRFLMSTTRDIGRRFVVSISDPARPRLVAVSCLIHEEPERGSSDVYQLRVLIALRGCDRTALPSPRDTNLSVYLRGGAKWKVSCLRCRPVYAARYNIAGRMSIGRHSLSYDIALFARTANVDAIKYRVRGLRSRNRRWHRAV